MSNSMQRYPVAEILSGIHPYLVVPQIVLAAVILFVEQQ